MIHDVEFALFRLFRAVVLALPLKSVQRLGSALGWAAYFLLGSRRKVALDNLRHAYPSSPEGELKKIAKNSFRNYGITLLEFFWFPNLTSSAIRDLVKVENPALVEETLARGNGVIFLSGHYGNWELNAVCTGVRFDISITIIVQTQSNKKFDEAINRFRTQFGNKVVPMGASIREIIRTLREHGCVAIAPDQSGAMEGVYIDFFGRKVATHQGPAVFALRSGAPLLMGTLTRRDDGSYSQRFEIVPTDNLPASEEERVIELTQRHTAILERQIRSRPDQWLWMHRRWKHTEESVARMKEQASA